MGTHVFLDIYGVEPSLLDSMEEFREHAGILLSDYGCNILNFQEHKFQPQGFTCIFMLAESHLSIHTWPERGSAACDVFTCGNVNTDDIARLIIKWFSPKEYRVQKIIR